MPKAKTKTLKRVSVRIEIAYDPEANKDPRLWNWKNIVSKHGPLPDHVNVAATMELSDVAVPVEA